MRSPSFEQRTDKKINTLPAGTLVVLKEDDDAEFSLYIATNSGYAVGDPLARSTHPSNLLELAKEKNFEVVPLAVSASCATAKVTL